MLDELYVIISQSSLIEMTLKFVVWLSVLGFSIQLKQF